MTNITESPTLEAAPPRRLARANDGRWLGGVCAGLGRYFDVNPLIYRVAFAALAFAGGTGLLLYVAAWLVIPAEQEDESIAVEALRTHRDRPWLLIGVGLLSLGGLLALSEARFWPGPGNVWLAATLAGAALVWWHVSNREPRPAATVEGGEGAITATARGPRVGRPSLLAPAVGGLLAAAGLFGLLDVLDVYEVDVRVALAAGLAIVGAAIAAGALTGRRVGGLVVLGLVLLASFAAAASSPVSFGSGVGERFERVEFAQAPQRTYELGIGELNVDLTQAAFEEDRTQVDVQLGIGDVFVTVPEGVALEIDARAGAGDVDVLGKTDSGGGAHQRISIPGPETNSPVLELEVDVALGSLQVARG